jgi:hypothetical protein
MQSAVSRNFRSKNYCIFTLTLFMAGGVGLVFYLFDIYLITSVQLLSLLLPMLLRFPTRKTTEPPSNQILSLPNLKKNNLLG